MVIWQAATSKHADSHTCLSSPRCSALSASGFAGDADTASCVAVTCSLLYSSSERRRLAGSFWHVSICSSRLQPRINNEQTFSTAAGLAAVSTAYCSADGSAAQVNREESGGGAGRGLRAHNTPVPAWRALQGRCCLRQ